MPKKWIKLLKLVFSIVTPFIAVIVTAAEFLFPDFFNIDRSITMALALLTGISWIVSLEEYDDEHKWEDIEKKLTTQWKACADTMSSKADHVSDTMIRKIDSVSNCQIQTFATTVEWVCAIDKLIETGHHSIAHASLDSATRNKAPAQHNAIWDHILRVCKEQNLTYRHLIRVRPNNFENLLERIAAGNATNETYFAYYELPQSFSFATFEVIDKRYVATRSPFIAGEEPRYMIIDNSNIAKYFLRYFDRLWNEAEKIEDLSVVSKLYDAFLPNYTEEEIKTRISEKFEALKKAGIMDDI